MQIARIFDNEKNELGRIGFSPDGLSFLDFTDSAVKRRLKDHYHNDYETLTGGSEGTLHYTKVITLKAGTREHFLAVTTELHFLKWTGKPRFFLIGEIEEVEEND